MVSTAFNAASDHLHFLNLFFYIFKVSICSLDHLLPWHLFVWPCGHLFFFNFYINSFDFVYLLAGQGQRNVTNSYRAGFHHLCSLIQCIFTNFWKVCKFLLYPLLNMLQIQEPPNTPRSFHPVPFGCEWFAWPHLLRVNGLGDEA